MIDLRSQLARAHSTQHDLLISTSLGSRADHEKRLVDSFHLPSRKSKKTSLRNPIPPSPKLHPHHLNHKPGRPSCLLELPPSGALTDPSTTLPPFLKALQAQLEELPLPFLLLLPLRLPLLPLLSHKHHLLPTIAVIRTINHHRSQKRTPSSSPFPSTPPKAPSAKSNKPA